MKNKGDKKQKKSDHAVETPPPPQVMDPSAPPSGVQEENENTGRSTFQKSQKRKTADEATTEKLAPSEEL